MIHSKLETGATKWRAYAALVAGVFGLALSPLFIRFADAPGTVTSFYRMLIATILLAPFALIQLRKNASLRWQYLIFPVAAGVFTSFDHGLWSTAIDFTSVANATLLNNVSPVWVALFAIVIWKEKLAGLFWVGLFATLAGASAVLGSSILYRPDFQVGDILALLSSLFYAGYYLITQKGRKFIDTLPYLWIMTFSSTICLLSYTGLAGIPLTGYSVDTYMVFLSAALVSQIGAYFFITYSLGNLPASVVTPTMVAQPILTALLAIPLAGEALGMGQIFGGLITLGGIYTINIARNRRMMVSAKPDLVETGS